MKRSWLLLALLAMTGVALAGHIRRTGTGYQWVPVNYTRTP